MKSTQQFLPIEEIRDDLVFLKDGSVSMIITTSAVNFALLFETEQISIIEAFASTLNSLSFPIQIVIRSKRLDVTSYLSNLDEAVKKQTSPLLLEMTKRYIRFVESLIKENDVLDKQFYVCLLVSSIELGSLFGRNKDDQTKRALTILSPRRDHVIRQLARIGLKVKQLETAEIVRLFYDIYNPSSDGSTPEFKPLSNPTTKPIKTEYHPESTPAPSPDSAEKFTDVTQIPQQEVFQAPVMKVVQNPEEQPKEKANVFDSAASKVPLVKNIHSPFVVEELIDELWPKEPKN